MDNNERQNVFWWAAMSVFLNDERQAFFRSLKILRIAVIFKSRKTEGKDECQGVARIKRGNVCEKKGRIFFP